MSAVETILGLMFALVLAYFAFSAVGDDFPLNLAVALLAFVVATALLLAVSGRGRT